MTFDPVTIALCGVLLVASVLIPRMIARQYRGQFGRSYGLIVSDLYLETERRAALLAAMAEAREQRIERLERRLELGR